MSITVEHVAIAAGFLILGFALGQRAKQQAQNGTTASDPMAEMGAWWNYQGTWGQ